MLLCVLALLLIVYSLYIVGYMRRVCVCMCVYIPIFLCIHDIVCVHCLATQCVYKFGEIVVVCDRERTHVANDNNDYH